MQQWMFYAPDIHSLVVKYDGWTEPQAQEAALFYLQITADWSTTPPHLSTPILYTS